MLPKLLKINSSTSARAQQRLLAEFDFFDQILLQQQQQSPATPAEADLPTSQLPYYLCGNSLSAADISLAVLGGYVVGASYNQHWHPAVDDLPEELQKFIQVMPSTVTFSGLKADGRIAVAAGGIYYTIFHCYFDYYSY